MKTEINVYEKDIISIELDGEEFDLEKEDAFILFEQLRQIFQTNENCCSDTCEDVSEDVCDMKGENEKARECFEKDFEYYERMRRALEDAYKNRDRIHWVRPYPQQPIIVQPSYTIPSYPSTAPYIPDWTVTCSSFGVEK
jgi:hypothetical protein